MLFTDRSDKCGSLEGASKDRESSWLHLCIAPVSVDLGLLRALARYGRFRNTWVRDKLKKDLGSVELSGCRYAGHDVPVISKLGG